jgi:hypothetical protein
MAASYQGANVDKGRDTGTLGRVAGTQEVEDLLTAPGDAGEIRRLTILFADLVDSTVSGHGHRIDDQHRRVPVVGVFSRANAYRTR